MNFLKKFIIFITLAIIIIPPIHELGHVLICRNHGWKVLEVNPYAYVLYDPTVQGLYLIGKAERIHSYYDEVFPIFTLVTLIGITLFLIIKEERVMKMPGKVVA